LWLLGRGNGTPKQLKIQNSSWKVLIGGDLRSDFPQNEKAINGEPSGCQLNVLYCLDIRIFYEMGSYPSGRDGLIEQWY
jgi:hypothetical protein